MIEEKDVNQPEELGEQQLDEASGGIIIVGGKFKPGIVKGPISPTVPTLPGGSNPAGILIGL